MFTIKVQKKPTALQKKKKSNHPIGVDVLPLKHRKIKNKTATTSLVGTGPTPESNIRLILT